VELAEIVDVVKVVPAAKAEERVVVVGIKVETGLTEVELEISECAVAPVRAVEEELLGEVWPVGDERASISDESK
jgi:hypothetical protein